MHKHVIAFQKNMVVTTNVGVDHRQMAMITQAELMRFGYMLNQDALEQLSYSDTADIKEFHESVIDYLKLMTGGMRTYKPIYEGFPEEVLSMTEHTLWMNQLVGYWNGGSFKPSPWTQTKATAFEHVKYKVIVPGTEADFSNIFTSLLKAGTSLTPADSKVIDWFIANYPLLVFPEVIPFKENLCRVLGNCITANRGFGTVQLPKLTTTDVLRIVVYLSGGDISLPAVPPVKVKTGSRFRKVWQNNPERIKFRFKKFKRTERKHILSLIEASNLDVRDMKLKDQRWIRLGEILHPGEYQHLFPKAYAAFDRIRNTKVVSWYGEVEKAFKMSFAVGLAKVSERPGEFLRRLDWWVRTNGAERFQNILEILARVGEKSSNKVLFETYTHFEERRVASANRSIMIKGARSKTNLPSLPAISAEKVDTIQSTIFDILKKKFALLPEMGDCWIDPELKKIPLPTNMRSLNDSLVPVIRGQRTPFGEGKKVIRPFVHWFDERGAIDIDLHGFLLGKNKSVNFGFNGIHSSTLGCYSGDVRNRQGACAEYVDINVNEAIEAGFNYFIMVLHNFNGGKLSDIKECVAGVMEREHASANSHWKPDTIANSTLLRGAGNYVLVTAYDLNTRESIYLDLDFQSFSGYVRGGDSSGLFKAIEPFIALPKVSVYDLLLWHVESRGRLVSKETAVTTFLFEDFASSYTKTIEYMGV